jgi:O-glycosyl hydrolase
MTTNGLHQRNNDGGNSHVEEKTPLMMSSNNSDDSIVHERKTASPCSWRVPGGRISIVALVLLSIGVAFERLYPFVWRLDSPEQEPQKVVVVPDTVSVKDDQETDSSTSSKSDERGDARPFNSIDQEPEVLSDKVPYRAMCEYYTPPGRRIISLSPRVLQTSLHEADKPWSTLQPCLVHSPNTPVEINTAAAPDAILNVSFSGARNKSPTILGFGGAFTEATSRNFYTLAEGAQQTVLELLFGSAIGLGYSMARIPIHSCDFSVASYTFDEEDNDFDLSHFDTTLQHDTKTIELVQRAVQTYTKGWGNGGPSVTTSPFRLVASPWSPPAWMKRPTWEDSKHALHAAKMTYSAEPNCLREGVGPKSKYAAVWARYLSRYISSYQALANMSFWALTVQNEPEFAAPWEACSYSAQNMTDFVQYHLGPTMRLDHPLLHILGFDHNKDHVNAWMMTMLNHTNDTSGGEAAQFIAGTAYHWYAGGIFFMSCFNQLFLSNAANHLFCSLQVWIVYWTVH